MQAPELQVSPELLHAAFVPHLHSPLVQVSVVPLQAATVAEHLQTLFAASQYDPEATPAQEEAVPHLHTPDTHSSPEMLHASLLPHLQTPLVHVSEVPLQEATVAEHLHILLAASQ